MKSLLREVVLYASLIPVAVRYFPVAFAVIAGILAVTFIAGALIF